MYEEKLYRQMRHIREVIYEIESLANILRALMYADLMEVSENDLIMLSGILNKKILHLGKLYEYQALTIEQIQ